MGPFNDIFMNSMHEPTGQEVVLCAEQITQDVPIAVESWQWQPLNDSASRSVVGAHALPEWSECCKLLSKSMLLIKLQLGSEAVKTDFALFL